MKTKFLDGPAEGVELLLHRCPVFLRVVFNGRTGEWDALDGFKDVPGIDEAIHVYRLEGRAGTVHLDRLVDGRRRGEWYQFGEYRHYHSQPSGDFTRDTKAWRLWAESTYNAEKEASHHAQDSNASN